MIPIPAPDITPFLLKLSKNPKFLRNGRILTLSLLALSSIGCAGVWAKGLEAWMPGCTVPEWGCYLGPPLSLVEYINQLGATKYLMLIPAINIFCAVLLLFQPRFTYLTIFLTSLFSFFFPLLRGGPNPYTNVSWGAGQSLHIISLFFLFLFSISLAIAELAGVLNRKPSWEEDWGLADKNSPAKKNSFSDIIDYMIGRK